MPSAKTSTVLLASAVPLIVGVVSLVVVPSAGLVMTGAAGAVVSMVTSTPADGTLSFPASSVAVAVKV